MRLLSLTTVTFSECRFIGNSAGNYGGGLFIGSTNLLEAIPESYWMFDTMFKNNWAFSAGYNAAWEVPPTNADIGYKEDYFCHSCNYEPSIVLPNYTGYSNNAGFATPPQLLRVIAGCPSSIFLDLTPFFVSLQMVDGFGSMVTGHIFETDNWTVQGQLGRREYGCRLSADSPLEQKFPFSRSESIASFPNITLYTADKNRCSIWFYARSDSGGSLPVAPLDCIVTANGCPDNFKVLPAIDSIYNYDTCVSGKT